MADPRIVAGRHRWVASLLRTYPGPWRRRYEAEMLAILDARPPVTRDTIDLLRGALDAHLHPDAPSRLPGEAAWLAGAAWTVVALAVLVEPAPPDWPGYLAWTLPVVVTGAVASLVASLGMALRLGDGPGRLARFAMSVLVVGHLAWAVAVAVAIGGGPYGAVTAAFATAAAVGLVATGLVLVRAADLVGVALVVIGGAVVLPPPGAWIVLAAAWIASGCWLVLERSGAEADCRATAGGRAERRDAVTNRGRSPATIDETPHDKGGV